MKLNFLAHSFLVIPLILLLNCSITAQDQQLVYDTTFVKILDNYKFKILMNDSLLRKVTISKSHPKHTQIKGKHIFGDIGRGTLTLISGIGTEDSKNIVDLKFINRIRCKEPKFDWNINLYCRGSMDNQINRNRNEDGGLSLSLDHSAYIDWSQGVSGIIMKGEIKIGEFILIKNPVTTDINFRGPLQFLNEFNTKYAQKKDTLNNKAKGINVNDYAIIGKLYDKKFTVINDFETEKISIYQDKIIKAILQKSDAGNTSFKNIYFLLQDPEISEWESTYWSILVLFFEYLNQTLAISSYQW